MTRVIVDADGGSRGNPGPAGYGAVVRDAASGAVLAERSGGLGTTTNNVAEYRGLIAGLRAALELGADEVEVRLDSRLVVEQMSGAWKVHNATLKPLHAEAGDLARRLGSVRYRWIPRAENTHADRLANQAMDEQDATDGESESHGTFATPWTGAVGEPTRLILLRHGQTALSVDRRYSGRGDVELTDTGRQQVEAAARRLETLAPGAPVIASPLRRTTQTARAVVAATGGSLDFHEGLVETDFGAWEGLTFTEASQRYERLHRSWLGDPTVEPPDGESLHTVFQRVQGACADVLARHAGGTVVIVSHVTPIKALLRLGLDVGPSLFYRLHLDLASLSVVDFYPDGNASVRLVNDTSHLL